MWPLIACVLLFAALLIFIEHSYDAERKRKGLPPAKDPFDDFTGGIGLGLLGGAAASAYLDNKNMQKTGDS